MCDMSEKVVLVIPCFNEEKRLNMSLFKKYNNYLFIFVNDGSTDNTLNVLKNNQSDNMFILNLDRNYGKGEAIRQGLIYLKSHKKFDTISWFGYWDADLSVPLEEVNNLLLFNKCFSIDSDAIFGSRIKRIGSRIKRSFFRHILGRLFITFVTVLLKINVYDSQCGAKLFKKDLISIISSKPFISKWIFDTEIILRLKQYKIVEYPLKEWVDRKGSKVKVLRSLFKVLLDIFKIRKAYKIK